ncbi:hypothetical protein CCR79_01260 [Halorhodospira halophila]|nr:hypothetical protein [Halorhodospira halophila]
MAMSLAFRRGRRSIKLDLESEREETTVNWLRVVPWALRAARLARSAEQVRRERGGRRVSGYDTGKAAGRALRRVLK